MKHTKDTQESMVKSVLGGQEDILEEMMLE